MGLEPEQPSGLRRNVTFCIEFEGVISSRIPDRMRPELLQKSRGGRQVRVIFQCHLQGQRQLRPT